MKNFLKSILRCFLYSSNKSVVIKNPLNTKKTRTPIVPVLVILKDLETQLTALEIFISVL